MKKDRNPLPPTEDRFFLEGPHSRKKELWIVIKAMSEFIRGFRNLHFVGPCVTVFGSARFKEDHPDYYGNKFFINDVQCHREPFKWDLT